MPEEIPNTSATAAKAESLCREAGFDTRWAQNTGDKPFRLQLGVPNGRYTRWRDIDENESAIITADGIPPATCLGDYEAILYKDKLEIEAALQELTPNADRFLARSLARIPGVEFDAPESPFRRDSGYWSLSFNSPDKQWSAEVGGPSRRFTVLGPELFRRGVTLKIKGAVQSPQHDEALAMLEQVGQAILFEIDLRYNIPVSFWPISWRTRARRVDAQGNRSIVQRVTREVSQDRPTLPRNSYPAKPLALYRYARSAANMPLLQFLAFYQVLEYYFASYFQREILDRMRQELLDPRFSAQDDRHLGRLVILATSQGKGFATEREQLRATVRACVSIPLLVDYLSDPGRTELFTGRQPIKGVARIDLKSSTDIRDQVSDRIYDIRCRIVHSKSDTTDYPDLILPFSDEAEALGPDIDLVRYLAQRILISRAEPLQVL